MTVPHPLQAVFPPPHSSSGAMTQLPRPTASWPGKKLQKEKLYGHLSPAPLPPAYQDNHTHYSSPSLTLLVTPGIKECPGHPKMQLKS